MIVLARPRSFGPVPQTAWLARIDRFFEHHRRAMLGASVILIALGATALPRLSFDADPLHLKDPASESMRALSRLHDDPDSGVDDVYVLADNLADARASAQRLASLPEVARAMTLASLVPQDQEEKRRAILPLAKELLPVLNQVPSAAPDDATRVGALRHASATLANAAADHPGPGAASAQHLARALAALARADAPARDRAERAFGATLTIALSRLASALQPGEVTFAGIPGDLREQWIAPSGQALVAVSPRLDPTAPQADPSALKRFVRAVQAEEPRAAGGPISVQGSAATIVGAFYEAGAITLGLVALILWVSLRRFSDVLRTLVPLLVSGLVTLELCALLHLDLNFANIIALPLLLGIGVAFKIYYVLAWRAGQSGFLQSGLTQAVVLSAATTATAFGSLWLSHHRGTASMGELLALSLACTLVGAVVFQPILMGAPAQAKDSNPSSAKRA